MNLSCTGVTQVCRQLSAAGRLSLGQAVHVSSEKDRGDRSHSASAGKMSAKVVSAERMVYCAEVDTLPSMRMPSSPMTSEKSRVMSPLMSSTLSSMREVAVREGHGAGHVAEVDPVVDHGHDVVARVICEDGRDLIEDPCERSVAGDGVGAAAAGERLGVIECGSREVEHGDGVLHRTLGESGVEERESHYEPVQSVDAVRILYDGDVGIEPVFDNITERAARDVLDARQFDAVIHAHGVAQIHALAFKGDRDGKSIFAATESGVDDARIRAHFVFRAVPCGLCICIARDEIVFVARCERKGGNQKADEQYK